MSRMSTGAPILVKPQANIYTVLAGVGVLTTLLALVAVCVKANQLGWLQSWLSP